MAVIRHRRDASPQPQFLSQIGKFAQRVEPVAQRAFAVSDLVSLAGLEALRRPRPWDARRHRAPFVVRLGRGFAGAAPVIRRSRGINSPICFVCLISRLRVGLSGHWCGSPAYR
mgnify:FL=1